MSLQTRFSTQLIPGGENCSSEVSQSAPGGRRSGGLRIYLQLLKVAVSIVLLGGVIFLVSFYYDISQVFHDLRRLSIATIGTIVFALFANTLAAVLRFKVIAKEIKHPITFRRAMAVVGAGSVAGAIFFQIAGQLVARGVVAGRDGIPFAGVVVITAYERFIAAIVSGLVALGGALFIFGNLYLDRASGGADLIKIIFGLIAAALAGAFMGYGRLAVRAITPLLTRHFVRRCFAVVGLTLLVQIPMMIAYVTIARALSPQTSIADLVAASAIVMFAASVPISFAGWGVREMSAVVALGTIGVAAHSALTAAVAIGIGSMLAMGVVTAFSLSTSTQKNPKAEAGTSGSIDYYSALAWSLPIAAATLVLFQIYVPVQSGLINVNLADPIAILAGVIFILTAFRLGRLPQWRLAHINIAILSMTLVLTGSLLIGDHRIGWTTWAVVNRFLGWFILLAYAATGALIVAESRKEGLRVLLLTFAGATAAIAGIEVVLVLLKPLGFQIFSFAGNVEGFAQNRNAFAFQLLMSMSAAIVLARGATIRITLLALMVSGLWFAGSRSGWIAAVFVIATGLYLRRLTVRETVTASVCAASAVVAAIVISRYPGAIPPVVPDPSSTHERIVTIVGGLELFFAHPLFGAGLGAFRNEMHLSSEGIPLIIHSTAVWLLAELGLIGFAVFTISATYIFFNAWQHARKEQASALIVLGLVAFVVMSGPADMLYQRTFWILMGASLALHRSGLPASRHHSQSASVDPLVARAENI